MEFINSTFKDLIENETIKETEPVTTNSIDFVKKVSDIIYSTPNKYVCLYVIHPSYVFKNAGRQTFSNWRSIHYCTFFC